MSKKFLVEVPSRDPSVPWFETVETFDTRESALEFVQRQYGADDQGRVCLINEVGSNEEE